MHAENLTESLRQHPFLAELSSGHMDVLVGCASNVHIAEGSCVMREGEVANKLYLIRAGRIALETDLPGRGKIRIQTVGPGDVLGWSWLIAPFRLHFTGVALTDVRAFALDAECLRKKCETDHHFGFEVLSRLSQVMERRLEATRMQLLDIYTTAEPAGA
ncbi:MAG TPA: cyclic nucleotide-binding domain-containing protein [Bacteroidota bacterium]|nr:cyclic nucleotide-binding domain-containing protein [Bacteroidota bacterium]